MGILFHYRSECPKCGNIDNLGESETKQTVHCQRCYHHYEYKDNPFFKGYEEEKYFNTTDVKAISDVKIISKPPRLKEQGVHRLKSAMRKLDGLIGSVEGIEDNIDEVSLEHEKYSILLEIDEIKWCIKEGLKDLEEGV